MRFRSGRRKSVVPRLERLDERAMPSVSAVAASGTLTIKGDHHANTIVITDDGTGHVTVVGDGQTTSFEGVSYVRVTTGAGADRVEYDLTGDLSAPRAVDVSLGNGNDTFVANVQGNLLDGGSLILVSHGGNGDDQLSVEATDVDVAAGAHLTANLYGQNGKDNLSVDYSGLLQGSATLSADGGNGKDVVSGNVSLNSATDPNSETSTLSDGWLTLNFSGGNGVDQISASLSGETDLSSLLAVVDGGHGKDTFHTSDNLTPVDGKKG